MARESKFQARFIKELRSRFARCIILKNDSGYLQGVPDLLILHMDRWAALEIKDSVDAPRQPNQEYYVELMDKMSFAAFVYPENAEEVLDDLQRAFELGR